MSDNSNIIIDKLKNVISELLNIIKDSVNYIKKISENGPAGAGAGTGAGTGAGAGAGTGIEGIMNHTVNKISQQSKIFKILMVICMVVSIFILIGVTIQIFNLGSDDSKPEDTSKDKHTKKNNDINILPGLFKEGEQITLYSNKNKDKGKDKKNNICETYNDEINNILKGKIPADSLNISSKDEYDTYVKKIGEQVNNCNNNSECKLNPNAIIINNCIEKPTTTTSAEEAVDEEKIKKIFSSPEKKDQIISELNNSPNYSDNDITNIIQSISDGSFNVLSQFPSLSDDLPDIFSDNIFPDNIFPDNIFSNKEPFTEGMSVPDSSIFGYNTTSPRKDEESKTDEEMIKKKLESESSCQSKYFYDIIINKNSTNVSPEEGKDVSLLYCKDDCIPEGNFDLQYSKISDLNKNINTYANTNYLNYTYTQAGLNRKQLRDIYNHNSSPVNKINAISEKIKDYKTCLHNSEVDGSEDDDLEHDQGYSILFG